MIKNKKLKVTLCIGIFILIGIVIVLGVDYKIKKDKAEDKKKERQKQLKIEKILNNIDDIYCEYNFNEIEKLYDELDDLNYDTTHMRELLEYDKSVYEAVIDYNTTLKSVDEGAYGSGSLRELLNTLITPTKTFNTLEINQESVLGTYISNVRNNLSYSLFNREFIENDQYDVDSWITNQGYRNLVKYYTGNILQIEIPKGKLSENQKEESETDTGNYENRLGNRNKPLKVGEQITLDFKNYHLYSQMNITLKLDSLVNNIATFSITLNKSVNDAPLTILSQADHKFTDNLSLSFGKCNNPKEYEFRQFTPDDVVWIMDTVSIGRGETKQICYDVTSVEYMVLVTQLSDIDNPNLDDYDKYLKGNKSGTYYYYTFFDVSDKKQ